MIVRQKSHKITFCYSGWVYSRKLDMWKCAKRKIPWKMTSKDQIDAALFGCDTRFFWQDRFLLVGAFIYCTFLLSIPYFGYPNWHFFQSFVFSTTNKTSQMGCACIFWCSHVWEDMTSMLVEYQPSKQDSEATRSSWGGPELVSSSFGCAVFLEEPWSAYRSMGFLGAMGIQHGKRKTPFGAVSF